MNLLSVAQIILHLIHTKNNFVKKDFQWIKEFSKKIPGMVQAFAWYLLEHRKTVKVRFEPPKVQEATNIYRKQNDLYRQFIDECIIESALDSISITELYTQYKDWFKDNVPKQSIPIKNDIEEYFSKLWGTPIRGKKWKGYRLRTIQDDIENGDAIILENDDLVDYSGETAQPNGIPNL